MAHANILRPGINRTLLLKSLSTATSTSLLLCLIPSNNPMHIQPPLYQSLIRFQQHHHQPFHRLFCSSHDEEKTNDNNNTRKTTNTKVNFSLSDSEDDNDDTTTQKEIDKTKLPPPYDPFKKNQPIVEEPEDPKNLQLIFHKMRSEGLMNNAVKMFDALSKDGLTHEALELFSQIKDKGHMPDVVAHTAVIEAYANAGGQSKEAVKVFIRMLACGVVPNAYTYSVLIKGLAGDAKLGDANKYLLEMMGKGMRPNAGTYTAVFEAYAQEEKVEEAMALLTLMKEKGFVPDEKAVREVLNSKRGQVFRTIINILFNK